MCRIRLSMHMELQQKQLAIFVIHGTTTVPRGGWSGSGPTHCSVGLVEPVFLSPCIFPGLFCALKRADLFHLLIRRANRLEI